MRPSQQLKSVLDGRKSPIDCDKAVKSWLRLHVYQTAKKVLAMPFDRRIIYINEQPESLRDMVKAECIRLNRDRG